MQQTSNYNFKLPEGADIVNPLVDMNPNWSNIDSLLKTIADRAVNTATATKSGTVFALVRSSSLGSRPISQVFRFVAPDTWHAGDSMTLEATPVTVTLPNGNTPGEGCFVSGADVFAIKNGSNVTLYVNDIYIPTASEVTTTAGDSVQDYIDNTKFKNLETWTPNIGENWETFLARIRDNSTKTIPANFIRCTVDGVSGLIFRQSRRSSATSWQYETDYFTGNSLIKYAMSVGSDTAVLRKYDILNGTVQNLSSADAQTINIYGLDV